MGSKSPSQSKARLLVLAVFVIGFAAGALSMNLYQRSSGPDPNYSETDSKPQERIVRQMNQKLSLTPEQQKEISLILDETFDNYSEIRKEMEPRIKDFKPRFDEERQKSRDRIRAVLTPEQLPRFEKMVEENDLKREKLNKN
jgi:Spy/CpxP family protein refolding chaperone